MIAAIISNYDLIREGMSSIIERHDNMTIKLVAENLIQAKINENDIDVILLDLHDQNEDELQLIKQMKKNGIKSKFVILDFNSSKKLFIEAIRCGVEGYVLGKSNEDEIVHIIQQVYRGKKCFDSYFIENMINEEEQQEQVKSLGIDDLTPREREILIEIGKGMSNRKISEKFFISEFTVKKHINHIFNKLKIRDRTKAALYANKCGIVDNII